MKKIFRNLFLAAVALTAFASCGEKERNEEELIDPWLRERTPVNVRLETQIGPAVITHDWRTENVGTVSVQLITATLDLTAVRVVALDFQYPDSEFCPTASIKAGDTIDLSDGTAEFTVTSANGEETRTYTISYTEFRDPLEGTYSFTPVGGIIDKKLDAKYNCAFVMIGGYEKNALAAQIMDKYWQWDETHNPRHEDDNILSFRLEKADDQTGFTYGTLVNTPGEDGKYADYVWNADELYGSNNDKVGPKYDLNSKYRLIPAGKSRWSKLGDGLINIHSYDDVNYESPLYSLELLGSGEYHPWKEDEKANSNNSLVTVNNLAFHRSFGEGPFRDYTETVDEWIFVTNIRNIFWLIQKDSDTALENHNELLAE